VRQLQPHRSPATHDRRSLPLSCLAAASSTALNLFMFNMPRLSVDIDLNYVGGADRSIMLADKPKVELAITAVCAREGLTVKRMPSEHAGGKWRSSFVNTAGSSDNLEVDLNFMLRAPLWPVVTLDSKPLGPAIAREIPVIDRHELAAGKLAALVARNASRDIFDARELLLHQVAGVLAQARGGPGTRRRGVWLRLVSADRCAGLGLQLRQRAGGLFIFVRAGEAMA
jgi:hypothetical protein